MTGLYLSDLRWYTLVLL